VSFASPVLGAAGVPAVIRNGNAAAKQAYTEGLQFEQVLVNQLAKQLTADAGAGADGSSDSGALGGASGDGSGSGLLGGGSATSGYASLIPQALSNGLMSTGGLGIAMEIAKSLDPSIRAAKK
jgi:hypothetical protein